MKCPFCTNHDMDYVEKHNWHCCNYCKTIVMSDGIIYPMPDDSALSFHELIGRLQTLIQNCGIRMTENGLTVISRTRENETCKDCGKQECKGLSKEDPSATCVDWVKGEMM